MPRTLGPRTEAGKRRSRRNARIHGLTANLPDGAEEAALMQQFGHNLEKAWFDYESGRYVPPPPRTPQPGRKYHGFQ